MITTIDSAAYPLYDEMFPTITVCSKQKQGGFDAWRMVTQSLDFIEELCLKQTQSKEEACKKYLPHVDRFYSMAINVLGPKIESHFSKLKLSQVVKMTATAATENILLNLYREIAILSGDPDGKFTPMASLYLTIRGYKKSRHHEPIIADLLLHDERCSKAQAEEYVSQWQEYLKVFDGGSKSPCTDNGTGNGGHPCCQYFSEVVMSHWNMSLMAMSYAIPHLRRDHTALLEYLGFKEAATVNDKFQFNNLVPLCSAMGSKRTAICSQDVRNSFDHVWTEYGVCVGFNAPMMERIVKV